MELPKITVPTYIVTLPSNGAKHRVRPFLVKEEKMLMMAVESKDPFDMINTTRQVIVNCLVDNDLDIDKIPFFDVDYLLVVLRAKSVSETIDINFKCNNTVESGICGAVFPVTLDILSSELVKDDAMMEKIELGGGIGAKMKYPSYADVKSISALPDVDQKIRFIQKCVDYLFDANQIYPSKDMDDAAFSTFVDGLTQAQFEKLESWTDNLPQLVILAEKSCSKCGFDHKIRYRNLDSFFL